MVEGPHQFDIESIKASLKRRQKIGRIAFGLWMGTLFAIVLLFAGTSYLASSKASGQLAEVRAEMQKLSQTADEEIESLRNELDNKLKDLEGELTVERERIPVVRNSINSLEGQIRQEVDRMETSVRRALAKQTRTINRLSRKAGDVSSQLEAIAPQIASLHGQAQETQARMEVVQSAQRSLQQAQEGIAREIGKFRQSLEGTESRFESLRAEVDLARVEVDEKFVRLAQQVTVRTFWVKRKHTHEINDWGWQISVDDVKKDLVSRLKILDTNLQPSATVFAREAVRPRQEYEFAYRNRRYRLVVDEVLGTPKQGYRAVVPFVREFSSRPHTARITITPEGMLPASR